MKAKKKPPETILTQLMLAGHEVDTRWTHKMDTAGECQTTNNTLHHLFVYLTVDQGSRMFVWSKLLISNLLSSLVCRYLPFSPHVHFMSTHMINDSRPSLFFITIPLLCIIVNAREIQNGKAWNKTYIDLLLKRNSSSPSSLCQCYYCTCVHYHVSNHNKVDGYLVIFTS